MSLDLPLCRDALRRAIVCGTILAAAVPAAARQDNSDAVAVNAWLESSACPIATVEAGTGFADLAPLREKLARVRVVGLGEATHGTREFFQLKHRMVEFLVEELGFTIFLIEGGYSGVLAVDEYVRGAGKDEDAARVVASNLAVIWNTEEVVDLVKWIRAHNARVPEHTQVRFLGFDAQVAKPAALAVLAYLERVAPEHVTTAKDAIRHLYPVTHEFAYEVHPKRPIEERTSARARLRALLGFLAQHRVRFTRATSAAEYEAALQHARLLLQSDDIRNFSGDARERHMAENVEYVVDALRPGARAVLWAHNFHVSHATAGFRPFGRPTDFRPMGSFLAERYGDAYCAVGFAFDRGSFQAGDEDADAAGAPFAGLVEFTLGRSPDGSLGALFAQRGIPRCFVDLRSAPPGAAAWLAAPQSMRNVGAEFSKQWPESEFATPVVLSDHFDVLFFVEETTRARPLPFDPTVRPYEG